MLKVLCCIAASLALAGLAATSAAEGPGSRIRAGPDAPRPAGPAAERDLQRCDAMRGKAKERCLKNLRAAAADEKSRGPEASGAASGKK